MTINRVAFLAAMGILCLAAPASADSSQAPIDQIYIRADGAVVFKGSAIDLQTLKRKVGHRRVKVLADPAMRYMNFMAVVDHLQTLGIRADIGVPESSAP